MTKPTTGSAGSRGRDARRKQSPDVTRIHPLIQSRLGTLDLRRTEIRRVEAGLAVDVIVRNNPTKRG